uniref:Uncharacterized protein n=1 Tax=Panagrolaimus superbus TaxID=310955 RepID=A0A914ZC58_9BILA
MSLGAALTEFITTDKLFSWKIDNFDSITKENLQVLEYTEECFSMLYENRKQIVTRHYYLLKSPSMTSIHPNDGVKYTATLSLKYEYFPGTPTIVFESSPSIQKTRFFYHINDDTVMKEWTDEFEWSILDNFKGYLLT